ncbi:MAG: AbrB family transcriptional regulator [Paracoccaceae bacterium]
MGLVVDQGQLRGGALTVAVAIVGAIVAQAAAFPAAMLTGPALFTSLAGLAGLPLRFPPLMRDSAFLALGVGIGTTMSVEATESILRWPLAFFALGVVLAINMAVGVLILRRWFRFDGQSAVLASAPGRLSFVLSLGLSMDRDVVKVTLVQSVRLLALTLLVPVIARLMGVEVQGLSAGGPRLDWLSLAVLILISWGVGQGLSRCKVPAALVIGAMGVTAVSHGLGWTSGSLPPWLGDAAFAALGALIGTRFTGLQFGDVARILGAAAAVIIVACLVTLGMALPVAAYLGMPVTTVLAAFAPGGAETMIALGAVLAANPSFVAASHVVRLFILTFLIPLFLRFAPKRK